MENYELFTTKLLLENKTRENGFMKVFADGDSNELLLGLEFKYNNKEISLCDIDIDSEEYDGSESMFHLNKFQTGNLIDFLTRIYKEM